MGCEAWGMDQEAFGPSLVTVRLPSKFENASCAKSHFWQERRDTNRAQFWQVWPKPRDKIRSHLWQVWPERRDKIRCHNGPGPRRAAKPHCPPTMERPWVGTRTS